MVNNLAKKFARKERTRKFFVKGYIWLVLALMYAPILFLIAYSFTDTTTLGGWNGFTFRLYHKMFKNTELMSALGNTLLLAFVSALLSTLLGTLGAIGIYYSKMRTQKIANGASQVPVVNAEIVTAISLALLFVVMFGRGNFSFLTLLIGHMVIATPFVVLSILPKLKQMDGNLYEAALDLGASPLRALLTVVLPEILPGIFSGFMLAVTLSLDDYIITQFTRPSDFNTLSTYIYDQTKKALPNEIRALAALIFVLMLVVVVVMNVRANRAAKRKDNKR